MIPFCAKNACLRACSCHNTTWSAASSRLIRVVGLDTAAEIFESVLGSDMAAEFINMALDGEEEEEDKDD